MPRLLNELRRRYAARSGVRRYSAAEGHAGFGRRIIDSLLGDPESDHADATHSAVYADWLHENGMPAAGRLVTDHLSRGVGAAPYHFVSPGETPGVPNLKAWTSDENPYVTLALVHRDAGSPALAAAHLAKYPIDTASDLADQMAREGIETGEARRVIDYHLGREEPEQYRRRYARLTLGEGRPGRHMSGEVMFTHDYHDEAGNAAGQLRVIPRDYGETLHVDWVGPRGVTPGEVSNTLGPEAMRSLFGQVKAAYPRVKRVTGVRAGGVNRAAPKRVVVPVRNAARKYAKVDGHVPAHPLVAGFSIEHALRHLANDATLPSHVRDTAKTVLTGGPDRDGGMIPTGLWALGDQLEEIGHPLASTAEGGYNWRSAGDKVELDKHVGTAFGELAAAWQRQFADHQHTHPDGHPHAGKYLWHFGPEHQAQLADHALGGLNPSNSDHAILDYVHKRTGELYPTASRKDVVESIRRHAHRAQNEWNLRAGNRTSSGQYEEFAKKPYIQPWKGKPVGYKLNELAARYRRRYAKPFDGKPVTVAGYSPESHLFPEERSDLLGARADTQQSYIDQAKKGLTDKRGVLPGLSEVKALAEVGEPARGGYRETHRTILDLLKNPVLADRFVTANAILSAQTGWEAHTAGAIEALAAHHAGLKKRLTLDQIFGRVTPDGKLVRGTYKGPDTYTGAKAEALKRLFSKPADEGGVEWGDISKGSYKTPNFGLAFVDPRGTPIDTHMGKLLVPGDGFDLRMMHKIGSEAGVPAEVSAAAKVVRDKIVGKTATHLAYKTLLAKAAADLGWEPREVQEAVWTATVAAMLAKHVGAGPRAAQILGKLNRRAVQAGWSLNSVLTNPEVVRDLTILGSNPRKIAAAIRASEKRTPAGPGSLRTGDPAALESAALRLPAERVKAAGPIAARLARLRVKYRWLRYAASGAESQPEPDNIHKAWEVLPQSYAVVRSGPSQRRDVVVSHHPSLYEATTAAKAASAEKVPEWTNHHVFAIYPDGSTKIVGYETDGYHDAVGGLYHQHTRKPDFESIHYRPPHDADAAPASLHRPLDNAAFEVAQALEGSPVKRSGIPTGPGSEVDQFVKAAMDSRDMTPLMALADHLEEQGIDYAPSFVRRRAQKALDDIENARRYRTLRVSPKASYRRRYAQSSRGDFIDALRRIRSRDVQALHTAAREVAKNLGLDPVGIRSALHDTPQGSTPGVAQAVYGPASPERVNQAAAWTGLTGNSPGVAVFHVRPTGPDLLHKFRFEGSGLDLRHKMDRAGITNRVLMPHEKGFDVMIPDPGGRDAARVSQFVKDHRVHSQVSRGHFTAVGSRDQGDAREKYRNVVQKSRPRRYSAPGHTHADFHRALVDNPKELTGHLAYADWLEENGQPGLAGVIRQWAKYPSSQDNHGGLWRFFNEEERIPKWNPDGTPDPEWWKRDGAAPAEVGKVRIGFYVPSRETRAWGSKDMLNVFLRNAADPTRHLQWMVYYDSPHDASAAVKVLAAEGHDIEPGYVAQADKILSRPPKKPKKLLNRTSVIRHLRGRLRAAAITPTRSPA